jgi:hypothetical protein
MLDTGLRRVEKLQRKVRRQLKEVSGLFRSLEKELSKQQARNSYRTGRRAPRGALRAAIHNVLARGKTLRPAEIVSGILKSGYPSTSTPRVLYTSVYLALKKDPKIRKTSEGFRLRAGA